MKKAVSLTLAFMLAIAVILPAAAITEETESHQGTTQVQYVVAPGYTVTIPTTGITLDSTTPQEGAISATGQIVYNETLQVTAASLNENTDNAFQVKYTSEGTATDSLIYTVAIKGGAAVLSGGTVLTVPAAELSAGKNAVLVFTLSAATPKYAATYTDTITFTVTTQTTPAGG